MYGKLSNEDYQKIMSVVGASYMPPEPKQKKKLNLKQIFFLKKKFKK
tara:strand:- start:271 stop:411 length:141 start_codon:yes stop_codon:yes gene_type:complete